MFVEIVEMQTGEVVSRFGPFAGYRAERVLQGITVLKPNEYFARIVEE
jgi:hypothetical protein